MGCGSASSRSSCRTGVGRLGCTASFGPRLAADRRAFLGQPGRGVVGHPQDRRTRRTAGAILGCAARAASGLGHPIRTGAAAAQAAGRSSASVVERGSADLAAGAQDAPEQPAAKAPPPPIWKPGASDGLGDVAATMVASPPADAGGAEREPTTLMPAWQPPPTNPPSLPETMAMPARQQPAAGVAAGPQSELTIESGPDAGHSHRVGDHGLRIGRSPDNDIILRDPATSGHHARLERRADQFWVVDLGSTNGTFVNGESIQEKQLNHGDRLTVGQNSVHFSLIGA